MWCYLRMGLIVNGDGGGIGSGKREQSVHAELGRNYLLLSNFNAL